MLKYISFLSVFFFQQSSAQSISKRTADSSGNIIITTSRDTLASGTNDCRVEGLVFRSDSGKYFAFAFYLTSPRTFFLTSKDKIRIRLFDGEVFEQNAYTEGEFFTKGSEAVVTIPISEAFMNKMYKSQVASISLITAQLRHNIAVPPYYSNRFLTLSQYMLTMNVYDENGINWSELTSMPLPEN